MNAVTAAVLAYMAHGRKAHEGSPCNPEACPECRALRDAIDTERGLQQLLLPGTPRPVLAPVLAAPRPPRLPYADA